MLLDRHKADGYEKMWTRFDIFTEAVPSVETASGGDVVEPQFLFSLYGMKHSSIECFSVAIAKDLIARGESPVGNYEAKCLLLNNFYKSGFCAMIFHGHRFD